MKRGPFRIAVHPGPLARARDPRVEPNRVFARTRCLHNNGLDDPRKPK